MYKKQYFSSNKICQMKVAIVFLTKKVKEATCEFALKINKETNYSAFIVSDEKLESGNPVEYTTYGWGGGKFTVKFADNNRCVDAGFCKSNEGSTNIKSDCIALDKFLYLFSKEQYDFMWVFEDDVFIPSVNCIVNLHKKYSAAGNVDLVTPRHNKRGLNENYWHWPAIDALLDCPKDKHHYSMVCAIGISKKMLSVVSKWAAANKRLLFCEVMFNTLAEVNGLRVKAAEELRSIVWMGEWKSDDFINLPNNLFHPVKEIELHQQKRDIVAELKRSGYIPTKPIPEFLLHE
jgi:hypothetical protein